MRRVGRMLEAALSKADLMSKLSRHEAQLMRQMERTITQLERLMRQRLEAEQEVGTAQIEEPEAG